MNTPDDSRTRERYQVDAPPNDLSWGFVACEAFHRANGTIDYDAKLFIRATGDMHLHTSEGAFPVKGYYFTKRATIIESDKTIIIDNSVMGDPDFDLMEVEIGISRKAWNVACEFQSLMRLCRTFDDEFTLDFPYIAMSDLEAVFMEVVS